MNTQQYQQPTGLAKSILRRWQVTKACGLLLCVLPLLVNAEIYIYLGPGGDRVMTDKPLNRPGYRLQHKRKDIKDAGHIMAGREQELKDRRYQLYDPYIQSASQKFNMDPALIKAVIFVESNFDPFAVSPKGARGLMQVMPQTAARYREKDLFSPVTNIDVGVRHLAYLLQRYSDDLSLALAAYNAGEAHVDRHQGIPPFKETQAYVKKVMRYQERYHGQTGTATASLSSL